MNERLAPLGYRRRDEVPSAPMTSAKRSVLAGIGVVAAVAVLVVALRGGDEPIPVSTPTPGPSPSPTTPTFALAMELGKVASFDAGRGMPPRRLRAPAEGVRRTIEELYAIGFVDPARWQAGAFPELPSLFTRDARRGARRDFAELTLGEAAAHLEAVEPRRARVAIRFAAPARGRPNVAVARTDFSGVGMFPGGLVGVRHKGRFTMRKTPGGWRVAAYEVQVNAPPPGVPASRSRASFTPELRGKPFFVLAIGSDARPGQRAAGARADSLHIIGVNPRKGRASVLGIPRDSFVPIPGVGTRKINEALFYGGPDLMVRTVEQLAGLEIDAYVLAGFEEFRNAVSGVGGFRVRIPYAMSDGKSGAYFQPGTKRMQGPDALAFSRNRYDAPGGDFGRSMNQGRVLLAAMREFQGDVRKDPTALLRWLVVGARYLETDLTFGDAADLLLALPSLDPGKVRNEVVSGSGSMVGGQSVVLLGSGARAMFQDLARDGFLGGR